jgi:hypothetical protein
MLNKIKPFADNILGKIIKIYYPNWFNKRKAVSYPSEVSILFYKLIY